MIGCGGWRWGDRRLLAGKCASPDQGQRRRRCSTMVVNGNLVRTDIARAGSPTGQWSWTVKARQRGRRCNGCRIIARGCHRRRAEGIDQVTVQAELRVNGEDSSLVIRFAFIWALTLNMCTQRVASFPTRSLSMSSQTCFLCLKRLARLSTQALAFGCQCVKPRRWSCSAVITQI